MNSERTSKIDEAVCPYGDMISVLSRTLAAANHLIAKLLADENIINLVPSHGDILIQLFAHEEVSMAALADAIGKDPSTVTTLVKKLVDAGYVKTEKNPEDRRITNVTLTDSGRALEQSFVNVSKELCNAMKSKLTSEELMRTRESLLIMKDGFDSKSKE